MSKARERAEGGGDAALTLDNIASIVTLAEAAKATRLSARTIRSAIVAGDLVAFIPGGRDVRHPGRGVGYRIHKADLQRWFFGAMRGES